MSTAAVSLSPYILTHQLPVILPKSIQRTPLTPPSPQQLGITLCMAGVQSLGTPIWFKTGSCHAVSKRIPSVKLYVLGDYTSNFREREIELEIGFCPTDPATVWLLSENEAL